MDKLNPLQQAQLHQINAATLAAIIKYDGVITIVAGDTMYHLFPGSDHYEQLKHKLSDFGCDHVAKKLQAGLNTCTTDQIKKAG